VLAPTTHRPAGKNVDRGREVDRGNGRQLGLSDWCHDRLGGGRLGNGHNFDMYVSRHAYVFVDDDSFDVTTLAATEQAAAARWRLDVCRLIDS
jgi:hypothetical protein